MANTYTQIYIQVVFAVEGRQNLIRSERRNELEKYMTGSVNAKGQKLLAVHCRPDHAHILVGLKPDMALSKLVADIKTGSTNYIKRQGWVPGRFSWQQGFGGFSYGHSQLNTIISYIRDQEKHHARSTFREEYFRFLEKFQVMFDAKYAFDFMD